MISRGDANTRERDYADVLALSRLHPVEARRIRHALERTAAHRGTQLTPLTEALDMLPTARQREWRAFLDRSGLPAMPDSFEDAVAHVASFVDPMLRSDPDLVRWNPSTGEWDRRQ